MNRFILLALAAIPAAASLTAQPRASANYSIAAETLDSGGTRAASAYYTHDASIGGALGVSEPSPAYLAKRGYMGQLYEIVGIAITAPQSTVNEGESLLLQAAQTLDDGAALPMPAATVAWTIADGPLASVSTDGLLTADAVHQDSAASVHASAAGSNDAFELLVLDVDPDNFGSYGDDGLPDRWQVQHFGENHPRGGADHDFSRNGQSNRFAYLADLDPTDPASYFAVNIDPAATPGAMRITFSPLKPTREYELEKTTLSSPLIWQPLTDAPSADEGDTRAVTDQLGDSDTAAYRIHIRLPE